jgi:site-specific DNA-methyltransferase (adenine-specific)
MTQTTKLIPLDQITIPSRFRKDYGDIPDLCRKIRSTEGIKFNFIVVEEIDSEYHLLAGGRRVSAYTLLSTGAKEAWDDIEPTSDQQAAYSEVPAHIRTNLSESERLLIEFIENMGRKDFLWQEAAELVKAYHTVQTMKFGIAKSGPGKDGWSIRDTATELGLFPSEVVHYLQLSEGMILDPTLKETKQKSKALTRLKRVKAKQIADILDLEDYDEGDVRIVCGDSSEYLDTIEDESIDLIITDPPWGIHFEERIADNRTEAYDVYDDGFDVMKIIEIMSMCYNKLKDNSAVYMFYSALPKKQVEAQTILETAGFKIEIIPLIWYKKHVLSHDSRETRHSLNYEAIFYGWKGERPLLNHASRNVIEFQVAYQNRIHSSEKPPGLHAEIINLHTEPGDMVLDPFGGSCNVADACKILNRKCLCIEKNEDLIRLATLRLRGI